MRAGRPVPTHTAGSAFVAAIFAALCLGGCLEKLPEAAFGVADAAGASDATSGPDGQSSDATTSEVSDTGDTDSDAADVVTDTVASKDSDAHEDTGSGAETVDAADTQAADGNTQGSDGDVQVDVATDTSADDVGNTDAADSIGTGTDAGGSICVPNATSCVGNVVALCDAAGAKLTPGEDCENTGKTCKDGACVAPQSGFAGHGGFINAPATNGGGFRVIRQGFGSLEVCGGGFCARGGLRP